MKIISLVLCAALLIVCLGNEEGRCRLRIKAHPKYGYSGDGHGPDHWGDKPEYKTCKKGKSQSPIDIDLNSNLVAKALNAGPKPQLVKASMIFGASNNNWGINCKTGTDCGSTVFKGKKYKVVNIHFHSPSEHSINGKHYDLEAHIVHKSNDGKYLVIGTFFEVPSKDSLFNVIHYKANRFFGANPLINQCLTSVLNGHNNFKVSLPFIMNPSAGFCTYVGSFTTPPCTEGVQWVIQLGVQPISADQVHNYKLSAGTGYYGNNRPVEPRNNRGVVCYA